MKIKTPRQELLALHSCIAKVISLDIPQPSEAAMLMSIMTELALQDEDKKQVFLKLKDESLVPCWHCCNIVLQNNLQKDHVHSSEIMSIMQKIAEAIDELSGS